ncbi:kinase-like domain-containing protein [Chaetomium tenue]|uniref:Kinase-like domain-containing protein n=1 Tax=Chaetomium tenue TaxID=1854479 RepID=A0ACB7PH83_9PEZI|nr:kinase-like domain-containing protein [Chaetomium globosum]
MKTNTTSVVDVDLDPNEALSKIINSGMQKGGPKYFFPTSKLEEVLERKRIEATLRGVRLRLPAEEQIVSKVTEFVTKNARPIFAGLVMMGKPWLITSFYVNGFGRENLPIRYTFRKDNTLDFGLGHSDAGKDINTMFRGGGLVWKEREIEDFCKDMQWEFTAPTFAKEKFRYEFAAGTVLPFTTPLEPLGSGGSARVEKAAIHRDHIDLSTLPLCQRSSLGETKHPVIALKTLESGTPEDREKDAEKEARNLEAVRKLQSDNLIKAIAYCRIGKAHCFLFPLADYGNLWLFWVARMKEKEEGQSHRGDNNFLVWVFTQLVGIADSLVELHGDVPNIRHGDLKPENILCFQDGSCAVTRNKRKPAGPSIRLVLTDVGISKKHKGPTKQRDVTSTLVSTTRYEPPEMEQTREDHSKLSRRFDMWSFGCILLEFLIWLLYDIEGLVNFTRALKEGFYESDKKGTHIHPIVSQWIENIKHDKRNCGKGSPFRDLVYLIEERLLIVQVESLQSETAESNTSRRRKFPGTLALCKSPRATGTIVKGLTIGRRPDPVRASAKDMRDELKRILGNIEREGFEVKRASP